MTGPDLEKSHYSKKRVVIYQKVATLTTQTNYSQYFLSRQSRKKLTNYKKTATIP